MENLVRHDFTKSRKILTEEITRYRIARHKNEIFREEKKTEQLEQLRYSSTTLRLQFRILLES